MFSNRIFRFSLIALIAICVTSCKFEVSPTNAIYIWESNRSNITASEKGFLAQNGIQKLYVKFFEIEKNKELGIHPTAKSEVKIPSDLSAIEIVPTVYIRNDVFKNVEKKPLDQFAENMINLIEKRFESLCENVSQSYSEIQMDCDWTISTQKNYFYFLKKLKEQTSVQISATLRLYPYKFPDKMGVLPVDRAMLMCYNLLSPIDAGKRNSILDLKELEKYLKGADKYPLPLDLALPIYSSVLMYQHDQFTGIHYLSDLKLRENLARKKGAIYHVIKDTMLDNTFLREGNQVKLEIIDNKVIQGALKIINRNVCFEEGASLSLFHLTSSQLNTFNDAEITSIYSPLSN